MAVRRTSLLRSGGLDLFRLRELIHWSSIRHGSAGPRSAWSRRRSSWPRHDGSWTRGAGAFGRSSRLQPVAGDLIPGTGGVRKLRWGLDGRGKRGGARVIYFHHGAAMPLFALTAYAKNERADYLGRTATIFAADCAAGRDITRGESR